VAHFVLVHGTWHGGWCWARLAEELAHRGHTSSAPDLPCEDVDAGAQRYAEIVESGPEAVVVGHSLGGMTIPLVPGRLHVFVAAVVPTPGNPAPLAEAVPSLTGTMRDELDRSYWPDHDTAAVHMYPELSVETVAWAFERLRPQARRPSTEPSPVRELPAAAAVVICTRDRIVLPEWQATAARELLGVEPVELGTGHFPMLERPRALAALLEGLAT
jgi:pimeloyl-ACP methyl ester carboxylesterase